MAGIEQLEIHSKSYIVRWVKVEDGYTVSWSLQPHKKSINFGIVKHPGTGATNLATSSHSEYTLGQESHHSSHNDGMGESKGGLFARRDASTAQEQLSKKGFIMVKWHGKCASDKVSTGTYEVTIGNGGMFGMVFDNTFSKQTSKHATFVLLTYPTGSAPQPSTQNLPSLHLQAGPNANSSRTSLGRQQQPSPLAGMVTSSSVDSLHSNRAAVGGGGRGVTTPANYHVGILLKRRRKKGQGFARRFFSLDFATCTLSYYHNRNSSALRGAIPLSLAAIAADERRREISIDSGAEIWHLKATSDKEFADWANALTRANRIARGADPAKGAQDGVPGSAATGGRPGVDGGGGGGGGQQAFTAPENSPEEEDREWQQVEALVSRVVGTRDALRRLVKDMSAQNSRQQQQQWQSTPSAMYLLPGTPGVSEDSDSYFTPQVEKKPFWKRKSSASALSSTMVQSSIMSQLAVPSPGTVTTTTTANKSGGGSAGSGDASPTTPGDSGSSSNVAKRRSQSHHHPEEFSLQSNCAALLVDLDSVVAEFSQLLASSKRRRIPVPQSAASGRRSIESTSTDEFFDAAEGDVDRSELLMIDNRSEDTPQSEAEEDEDEEYKGDQEHDGSSASSVGDGEDVGVVVAAASGDGVDNLLYPAKPKSLAPLPVTKTVPRRRTIPPAKVMPPSLIAFVRKNVGKDLSTISMPVSANEPTSLLQRMAEQLEYASLLDSASKRSVPTERLLYVAAFAISQYSSGRAKERAMRKPFNPLLGETFELLRSESEVPGGMRLIVEKVSHRPVRLAMHADGAFWSFAHAPAPTQKFWGKSMELTTEGRVRISLRLPDGSEERYSWALATVFLRNVVMGEKYVEPAGTMAVINDTTGHRAAIEFKSKGMFGGRGEDVQVETFGPDGSHTGTSMTGTWTGGLKATTGGRSAREWEVWTVGKLVDNPAATYGLTTFAASLNEITALEHGKLPPTDTRLRPDQRFAEQANLEDAESWKVRLEEAQRVRRKMLEERGEQHQPRWFAKVSASDRGAGAGGAGAGGGHQDDGDEVWKLKVGKDGYWEERGRGGWSGVEHIFV